MILMEVSYMASKDFRKREKKKAKKDVILKKIITPAPTIQPTFSVEVVKKKRKTEEEELEE